MACDLHIHSTASDGGFSPSEVVEHAYGLGLTYISLTDHDTFDGIEEAQGRASELGIPFISGIEMTTVLDDHEIHILGYFADHNDETLNKALEESHHFTLVRLKEIIRRLARLGYPITIEEVKQIAGKGSMGRPHIARAMVRRGYVENNQEAFEHFIGLDCPAYVAPQGMPPEKAYRLILGAGGIPAIAHPGLFGRADMMRDDKVSTHREWGVLAIEAFHPRHDNFMINYYIQLARKLRMGIVGGSDCHGSYYAKILMDRKAVPDWVAQKFLAFYEEIRNAPHPTRGAPAA